MLRQSHERLLLSSVATALLTAHSAFAANHSPNYAKLEIIERTPSEAEPPIHTACYSHPTGPRMIGPAGISSDAGRTWTPFTITPDFSVGLPPGYRRVPYPSVLDQHTGRIVQVYNALDTPGLDPKIAEPALAQKSYYLRYRVSIDAGRSWLFDAPVIQQKHTEGNPIEGVWKGKNAVYLGDIGSIPIFTSRNELLVPVQICPLGKDGQLSNPGGGPTYHETAVLIGRWDKSERVSWQVSSRVVGDPSRTTRGLFEPTLTELDDGRFLMIMRGSNARRKNPDLPCYKWRSISTDGGRTWTAPLPWTYADGSEFFSPSSMSRVFKHSTGHIFWIGNITPQNPDGNLPRYPLVIGEVDPISLGLIKPGVVDLDTREPTDPRVDISHFRAQEDVETNQIVVTVPRALNGYKSKTWTTYRLKVTPRESATAVPKVNTQPSNAK